jgi:hypothetical protein
MNSPIIYLYSVLDVEAKSYGAPMHFMTDLDAIRWFRTQCYSDPVLYHNRKDFDLICLGFFDRVTGTIIVNESDHRLVYVGSSVKQMVVDEQAESTEDFA